MNYEQMARDLADTEARITNAILAAKHSIEAAIKNADARASLRGLADSSLDRRASIDQLSQKLTGAPPPDAHQALINARLDAIEAAQAHQDARIQALEEARQA